MKRIALSLAAALALVAAVPAAAEHGPPAQPPEHGFPPPGERPDFEPPEWDGRAPFVFRGVVRAVDEEGGSFTAHARLIHRPYHDGPRTQEPGDEGGDASGGGSGDGESASGDDPFEAPERELLSFRVDDDTAIYRDGEEAELGDLRRGDMVHVVILAERDASMEEVLATPAWLVAAHRRPVFYGFAGRVRAVDADARTVTIDVRYATRAARRLLAGGERPRTLTFKVGDETRVWIDGEPGELGDLSAGDLAGVGFVGGRDTTLDDLLALPADALFGLTEGRASGRKYARMGRRAARMARAVR